MKGPMVICQCADPLDWRFSNCVLCGFAGKWYLHGFQWRLQNFDEVVFRKCC